MYLFWFVLWERTPRGSRLNRFAHRMLFVRFKRACRRCNALLHDISPCAHCPVDVTGLL